LIQTTPALYIDETKVFIHIFSVALKNLKGSIRIDGKKIYNNWKNLER
jgi:hypothetical protein